ncbi:hypothetical protein [Streptomyces sp. cmx-4-9]|uniref:hypothetical protein n=1 Tax=Streptomyces sp. cmx-4-9 TaxID=2790941 RepID=UPI003980EBA5
MTPLHPQQTRPVIPAATAAAGAPAPAAAAATAAAGAPAPVPGFAPAAEEGVRLVGFTTAGPGGAMTDEVGVITGELTLATEDLADGTAALTVQYTGAEEWYTLAGSPVPLPEAGLARLHEAALAAIGAGGGAHAPAPPA